MSGRFQELGSQAIGHHGPRQEMYIATFECYCSTLGTGEGVGWQRNALRIMLGGVQAGCWMDKRFSCLCLFSYLAVSHNLILLSYSTRSKCYKQVEQK